MLPRQDGFPKIATTLLWDKASDFLIAAMSSAECNLVIGITQSHIFHLMFSPSPKRESYSFDVGGANDRCQGNGLILRPSWKSGQNEQRPAASVSDNSIDACLMKVSMLIQSGWKKTRTISLGHGENGVTYLIRLRPVVIRIYIPRTTM